MFAECSIGGRFGSLGIGKPGSMGGDSPFPSVWLFVGYRGT